MSKQNRGVPGDAVRDAAMFAQERYDVGMSLLWLDKFMGEENMEGLTISSVTVRAPKAKGLGTLVVVRGRFEGKPVVGFHEGDNAGAALKGAVDRIESKTLKWKEDEFVKP